MIMKSRKFSLLVKSILPCDSSSLFREISFRNAMHYVGIYLIEDKMYIFMHFKNVLDCNKIKKIVQNLGIDVENISIYTKVEGQVQSEHGEQLRRGRPKKIMRIESPPTSSPSGASVNQVVPRPPVNQSLPTCGIPHMDDRGRDFHAIWGGINGNWFPFGYIGPDRSIVPGKRRSVSDRQTEELFKEQDNSCASCGCDVYMGKLSNADVDHIIPLRLGGSCCTSNLQILCVTCHRRKTALECKKIRCNVIVGPNVQLEEGSVYIACSDIDDADYEIVEKNPKDALYKRDGLFKLVY